MQICKNQTTNIVYYMFNDGDWVTLTDVLRTIDFVALDMNSTKDELELSVPEPDLFVGGIMSYTSGGGWVVEDQTAYDEAYAARDVQYRADYEENMNSVMVTAQIDALGDPKLHRYSQGMQRFTVLNRKVIDGASLDQEEVDFIDGAEIGLEYQEANAITYSSTVHAISTLSGSEIISYPMPSFEMNPATHSGYQPYLDYLNAGFVS